MSCLDTELSKTSTHVPIGSKSPIKTKPAPVYLLITYQFNLISPLSTMKSQIIIFLKQVKQKFEFFIQKCINKHEILLHLIL